MAFRRPKLRRLDLLVIGASPEKLAQKQEIPAIAAPGLPLDSAKRSYLLQYRESRGTIQPEEQLELERLRRAR